MIFWLSVWNSDKPRSFVIKFQWDSDNANMKLDQRQNSQKQMGTGQAFEIFGKRYLL